MSSAPAPVSAQATGSLTITPTRFYGGQPVTFSGRLPGGKQTFRLQYHMRRPGDVWTDIPGSHGKTDSRGRFRFQFPARSMKNILLRVKSDRNATNGVSMAAMDQQVVLSPTEAVVGQPFTISVDTAPRQSRVELMPLPGRPVTLQRRDPATFEWHTVATGVADAGGFATFEQNVSAAGPVVYRAVAERHAGVGWFPSFPTYVDVMAAPQRTEPTPIPAARTGQGQEAATFRQAARLARRDVTASAGSARNWWPIAWHYAFEYAEDLTTPPMDGKPRKGWWRDVSTGTGRVSQQSGGMFLDSSFDAGEGLRGGPGDWGTTNATLMDYPMTRGRFEVRLLSRAQGDPGDPPYRIRAEIIPTRAAGTVCSPHAITFLDMSPGDPSYRFGVRSPAGDWVGSRPGNFNFSSHAFAVEVGTRHITFFLDNVVVGVLKGTAAIPKGDLTVRVSMVGSPDTEMQQTEARFDWLRGWPLKKTGQVKKGPSLQVATGAFPC
ncbi:hypothetical protein [Nocardioides gansuensis]|uniref:hypothetical protein n=1 Tax=Nocardioides gansuensis TaxID=2138300 RepID=UPI0014028E68|nr:hypothetical protein [Nocardioides gansuensis]